ncbi:hypothetical protein LTR08_006418 [Meristemomyces frigidus]|nr:hypothetical protein LTR08_006418 [Meristemomyces frigidus]
MSPPHKLPRGEVKPATSSLDVAATSNVIMADADPMLIAGKEVMVQASALGQKISDVVEALIQKVEVEKLKNMDQEMISAKESDNMRAFNVSWQQESLASRAREQEAETVSSARLANIVSQEVEIQNMRTHVGALREEVATFGSKQSFQSKLLTVIREYKTQIKGLKTENDSSVRDLKKVHREREKEHQAEMKREKEMIQAASRTYWAGRDDKQKRLIAELKQVHKTTVNGAKASCKDEEKAKEIQKAKGLLWLTEMSELRAKHKEELAKTCANVRMVEAAQKVVQLNAEKEGEGGVDGQAVVKLE